MAMRHNGHEAQQIHSEDERVAFILNWAFGAPARQEDQADDKKVTIIIRDVAAEMRDAQPSRPTTTVTIRTLGPSEPADSKSQNKMEAISCGARTNAIPSTNNVIQRESKKMDGRMHATPAEDEPDLVALVETPAYGDVKFLGGWLRAAAEAQQAVELALKSDPSLRRRFDGMTSPSSWGSLSA